MFNPNVYQQERIRQAKLAFNVYVGATVLSGLVIIGGVVLSLSGRLGEGVLSTVGGSLSTRTFMVLAKDANDRLDRAMDEEQG